MAVSLIRHNLDLFGIKDITSVIVEGHNQFPDRSEALIREGIERAAEAAKSFKGLKVIPASAGPAFHSEGGER
ncbi:hypothetical protein LJK88_32600 [Paenibacillus sp. P26]|nr:hypothetical protein LJK88_32600 [Paenibacillus sp. P26]UUZ94085.1 hypothetical protein LJK87_05505 [Paenibacillus sp. P25]